MLPLLFEPSVSPAQEGRKSFTVVKVSEAPKVDGRLDEAVWQEAAVVDDMLQVFPQEDAEPTERTVVLVMYDEDHLYVGGRIYDSSPAEIVATQLIQGGPFSADDRFWIIVDTFNTKRNSYFFQVNPNGIRRDALWENNVRFIEEWDTIWRVETRRNAEGWIVEMAIPFKSISFDPGNTTWGINFARIIPRKNEQILWSSPGQVTIPAVPAFAGEMHGLEGLRQGLGLDVVPSVTASSLETASAAGETELEPSLDVFYKPTPSLTAALTVNTDFSATEVDDRQVNLTRFDLFFPEKRNFFLQDAGIFEFGGLTGNGRPFFSRRIGLDEDGKPVDVRVGAKLTGRLGIFNLGFLDIVQDGIGQESSQNLAVARVTANVLEESYVGVIATDGDPLSEEDNTLVGLDFHYRKSDLFGSQVIEGDLWFQKSETPGVEGNDAAFGLTVDYPGDKYNAKVSFAEIRESFKPALGFVNRGDTRSYTASFRHRVRPEARRYFRTFDQQVTADVVTDLDDEIESQTITFSLTFENQSKDVLSYSFAPQREVLDEPFRISDGVVIPIGSYDFDRHTLSLTTSAHRPLALAVSFSAGDYYDGERTDATLGVDWRPSKHFFLGTSYTQRDVDLEGGRFIVRIAVLRANVAFNSEWSWSNFVQFDNDSDVLGVNSRLRWIPQAGKEVFFVFNQDFQADRENEFDSVLTGLTLKAEYTFRF